MAREMNYKQARVSNWKIAEQIPVKEWGAVLKVTQGRGIGVETIEDLYRIHGYESA